MRKFGLIVCVFSLMSFFFIGKANASILIGPTLTNNAIGWSDTGLSITALENVVLESFLFHNQGAADTIQLYNSSTELLQTYNYSGGDLSHLVDVSWDLTSGQTYKLLSHQSSNGKWEAYPGFPLTNDQIRVNSTIIQSSDYQLTGYWFNFTNLTTTVPDHSNAVPEPSTMLLLGAGLLGGVRLRRRSIGV